MLRAAVMPIALFACAGVATSEDYSRFKGVFKGIWKADGDLASELRVKAIDKHGNASIDYLWGDHPKGHFKRGVSHRQAKIEGARLSFTAATGAKRRVPNES